METGAAKLKDASGKIIGLVVIAAAALGIWYFMTQQKKKDAGGDTGSAKPSFVPTSEQPFDPQTASYSTLTLSGYDLPAATSNGATWVMVQGSWILATQYNPVINGIPTVSDMSYIAAHGGTI